MDGPYDGSAAGIRRAASPGSTASSSSRGSNPRSAVGGHADANSATDGTHSAARATKTSSSSVGVKIDGKVPKVAAPTNEAVCREVEIWIHRCPEGTHTTGAHPEDYKRPW